MPLIYTLVKRKDMSKDAASGATLYHAQTSITKKLTLNKICTRIENICTASRGEIILVLDGLIKVMNEALSDGESVHLGEFGSFRMVAGSKGSATVDGFTTALFNHCVEQLGEVIADLDTVLFGGEQVDPDAVRALLDLHGRVRVLHVYGPTENTTFSSWHPVDAVAPDAADGLPGLG